MTKLVLGSIHHPEIVFKIPFMGLVNSFYDCENKKWEKEREYFGAVYKGNNEKLINLGISQDNHCEWEEKIYHAAEKEGVEDFFAEVKQFTTVGKLDYPIYISPRVPVLWSDVQDEYDYVEDLSEDMKEEIETLYKDYSSKSYGSKNLLTAMILQSSYEKVKKLLTFLDNYEIDDLHDENIGLTEDNKIVIIDYAGFRTGYC